MVDMCSCPPPGGMPPSLHIFLVPVSEPSVVGNMQLFCSFKRRVSGERLEGKLLVDSTHSICPLCSVLPSIAYPPSALNHISLDLVLSKFLWVRNSQANWQSFLYHMGCFDPSSNKVGGLYRAGCGAIGCCLRWGDPKISCAVCVGEHLKRGRVEEEGCETAFFLSHLFTVHESYFRNNSYFLGMDFPSVICTRASGGSIGWETPVALTQHAPSGAYHICNDSHADFTPVISIHLRYGIIILANYVVIAHFIAGLYLKGLC